MMFHVGQLVICVDDEFPYHRARGRICPKKGVVYTIRQMVFGCKEPGVYLAEIVNPPAQFSDGFAEPGWFASHFRPLDDSHLEIFRQALRTVPVEGESVA